MRKEAVVVVIEDDEQVLGVSRRDDPNAFGLPGGKVDPGETPEQAAAREFEEETGFRVKNLVPFFQHKEGDFFVTAFTGDLGMRTAQRSGETGVVAWVDRKTLCTGPFGEFNRKMFKELHEPITVGDVAELMKQYSVPPRMRAEFMRGLEVEWEHAATVNYHLGTIAQIVCDHLGEDPHYYRNLRRAHRENPQPERVDFARYEEYARGLSDDQIEYALQDILETIPHATSLDREYDTSWREGKYLDQASVLVKEQRRRGLRKNPLLPSDFFGFDTFDTEDEDTEYTPTLRDTLQRGDVVRAGGSRWVVVHTPKGSFDIFLYKFPSKNRKMYTMLLGEDVWEIHEINGLGDNIAFIAKGHPDDITVEEGAGLVQLGDRRSNPQKRWPRGSQIQTLIFDRDMFTPAQAKNWAVDNEFKTSKVDLQPNTIRLRQIAPSRFDSRYGFRTIQITDGVQATVGVPLE